MTDPRFRFTFAGLEQQYRAALARGYEFATCADYLELKRSGLPARLVVNRVDIDFSVRRAERLGLLFATLGIKGTFFVRLHAKEYNPFAFEDYRVLRGLVESGHEIGYHSEIVDASAIWQEPVEECLRRDIDVLSRMLGVEVQGAASHGGLTGLNNLDFWNDRTPEEFGLKYEAYDRRPAFNLFSESFYVSDSEWTRWKCYDRGTLVEGDCRSFGEHVQEGHGLIYLLIHPDTYFERHCYE